MEYLNVAESDPPDNSKQFQVAVYTRPPALTVPKIIAVHSSDVCSLPPNRDLPDEAYDCHDRVLRSGTAIRGHTNISLFVLSVEDAAGDRAAQEFARRHGIDLANATAVTDFGGRRLEGYVVALGVEELPISWHRPRRETVGSEYDCRYLAFPQSPERLGVRPLFDVGAVTAVHLTQMGCAEELHAAYMDYEAVLSLYWCSHRMVGKRCKFTLRPQ